MQFYIYTVIKTSHFIFYHDSHVAWSIFVLFILLETGIKILRIVHKFTVSSCVSTLLGLTSKAKNNIKVNSRLLPVVRSSERVVRNFRRRSSSATVPNLVWETLEPLWQQLPLRRWMESGMTLLQRPLTQPVKAHLRYFPQELMSISLSLPRTGHVWKFALAFIGMSEDIYNRHLLGVTMTLPKSNQ